MAYRPIEPLKVPENIAFAGDWHANPRWAVASVEYAKEQDADVMIHLGDFGYDFNWAYLRVLTEALRKAGIPLLFVDGNHENHKKIARYPIDDPTGLRQVTSHIYHIPRGFSWTWNTSTIPRPVTFMGIGGAHSVDGQWRRKNGHLWQKEETITQEQAEAIKAGPKADILVSHECPTGVDIPGLDKTGEFFPWVEIMRSEEHRQLFRTLVEHVQPRYIFHGHYHRNYNRVVDFGYGPLIVFGLDCDGTDFKKNVVVHRLFDLSNELLVAESS